MSATILTKTGVTLLFAINANLQALAGYIAQSDTQDLQSKVTDALDANGSTVGVAFYDQYIDYDFTALLVSGTTVPSPGAIVSINSVKYAVLPGAATRETNTKFTEVTIKLRRWLDNSIPA